MKDNRIIASLDIGTTKITTVIGELVSDGTLDIIGEGTVPNDSLKKGTIVNLERAISGIKQSILAAERVAGVKVQEVYLNISGPHIKAITSHGLAAIRRNQDISKADVERAIENARAVPLEAGVEVIHAQPQEFVIDGQEGIRNPIGMHGVRLEVDVHIVTASSSAIANLRRCVGEIGLSVKGIALQGYAAGMAVLDSSDLESTVVVLDVGGGSTDVTVFKRGNLAHSSVVPIGSDHISSDLAQLLNIPIEEAARIKHKYGSAVAELADPDLSLEINQGNRVVPITAVELTRLIRPRVLEIYSLVRDDIDRALGPVELLANNLIITGGGSQLRGMVDLARERFRLPARLGVPRNLAGLHDIVDAPQYTTAVGLIRYGALEAAEGNTPSAASVGRQPLRNADSVQLPPIPEASRDIPAVVKNPTATTATTATATPTPATPAANTSGNSANSPTNTATATGTTTPTAANTPATGPNPAGKTTTRESGENKKGVGDRLRDFFKDFF